MRCRWRRRRSDGLCGVATILCTEWRRRSKGLPWGRLKRHNREDEGDEEEGDEETLAFLSVDHGGMAVVAEREHIQLALARLPHEYAAVLVLSVAQGIPYQEIARIIGLSPGATASRLSRAKKMFVEQYQRISQEHDGQRAKQS